MAELACELSPLVYSEFYRMLAGERALKDALVDRILEAGLEIQWLDRAIAAYDAKWDEDKRSLVQAYAELVASGTATSQPPEPLTLSSDHAVLASWLLAGLRPQEIDGLGTKLNSAISTRLVDELPELLSPKPRAFWPVIIGWTFGMLVDDRLDPQLPAIPAQPVKDPNIAAAYAGLVNHVAHLVPLDEPWPEVLGTSTLIRGAGLAESLRPDAEGPRKALEQLMLDTKRAVPDSLYRQLIQHWTTFVTNRDSVVHILPYRGSAFTDVVDCANTWDKIRLTIRGITQFVFQEVARELAEPRIISAKTWESLGFELEVYS